MPKPGFTPAGQPKVYPVNIDDRKPHWMRCKLTCALRAEKSKQLARPVQQKRPHPQPEPEGVQLDAFDHS